MLRITFTKPCVYDLTVVQKLPVYQVQWLRVKVLQAQVTRHLCSPPGLIRVESPECDVSHRDSLMSDLWIIPGTGYKFLVTPGSLSVLGFLIYLSCKDRAI